ncbi:hypothetical protein RH858_12645 [Halalkaliarchaeum sp. AArc-GB]|uniref:hypothetical protein n=1 Tax=Halalkaliarchaeum sp. AArc-GB TaxID=3074078 RepID=UPI0028553F30|nr:hypothetical protein [Halalkaliarchaeum sp. AArc-GB]MDR5673993.1 hypothetical protein [Halalkaliarchaeum sp. AArc-GB]
MYRRTLLGCVPVLALGAAPGCLAVDGDGGVDDREVHQVVREWETDRTFSLEAATGEFLVVALDTRRPVPGRTTITVFDPGEQPIATYQLTAGEPTVVQEVRTDGRYGVLVTPEDQDRQPVRVWIRITVEETPPETRLERRSEAIFDAIDESAAVQVRGGDIDDSRLFVAIQSSGEPEEAVMTAARAYAEGVAEGFELPFEGVVVDPNGEELARFEIAVRWAQSYAAGEISRGEYLERVFETVDWR